MKVITGIRSALIHGTMIGCIVSFSSSYGCTILNVTQDGTTYVAANEDWTTDRFFLRVQPPEGTNHGMFVFGVDDPEKYPFFGFNDQGLFFDLASAPQPQELKSDPKKETRDNRIYIEMLAKCSIAREAVEFLARFNITGLQRHHIMVVDRNGASAVIEGTPEGHLAIWKNGRYQIIANFLLSSEEGSAMAKTGRYAVADRLLKEIEKPTIEAMRSILRETRNSDSRYPTVFSSIVNLNELRLHLYYKGDFDRCLVIDMHAELQQGKSLRRLSSSFAALSGK